MFRFSTRRRKANSTLRPSTNTGSMKYSNAEIPFRSPLSISPASTNHAAALPSITPTEHLPNAGSLQSTYRSVGTPHFKGTERAHSNLNARPNTFLFKGENSTVDVGRGKKNFNTSDNWKTGGAMNGLAIELIEKRRKAMNKTLLF